MGRSETIAQTVVKAVTAGDADGPEPHGLRRILTAFAFLFTLYRLPLVRVGKNLFANLRRQHWRISEDDYVQSFTGDELQAIGDMGYSGSTFFDTKDGRYMVKSIPRHFEHSFFRDDLLEPYATHMEQHPTSLLVRICDFLASPYVTIGSLLGIAPAHHIVMENIMHGKNAARKWEHWDLKPQSYFFPERDIAQGKLASEATKSRLADDFNDKIILSQEQADDFFALLIADTKLLAECNAVDYSLFLIRISPPADEDPFADSANIDLIPTNPPSVPPAPPTWRTGIPSTDLENRYVYRAAILDFFWAKHKTQPRVMTALVRLWNLLISRHGHMSITTSPQEYRERFIQMCREMVEVREAEVVGSGS